MTKNLTNCSALELRQSWLLSKLLPVIEINCKTRAMGTRLEKEERKSKKLSLLLIYPRFFKSVLLYQRFFFNVYYYIGSCCEYLLLYRQFFVKHIPKRLTLYLAIARTADLNYAI